MFSCLIVQKCIIFHVTLFPQSHYYSPVWVKKHIVFNEAPPPEIQNVLGLDSWPGVL